MPAYYNHRYTFRLDKVTLEKLKKDAKENGLSESAYLRKRIWDDPIVPAFTRININTLRLELNRIGNNINQLATHANSGYGLTHSDQEIILGYLNEMRSLLEGVEEISQH